MSLARSPEWNGVTPTHSSYRMHPTDQRSTFCKFENKLRWKLQNVNLFFVPRRMASPPWPLGPCRAASPWRRSAPGSARPCGGRSRSRRAWPDLTIKKKPSFFIQKLIIRFANNAFFICSTGTLLLFVLKNVEKVKNFSKKKRNEGKPNKEKTHMEITEIYTLCIPYKNSNLFRLTFFVDEYVLRLDVPVEYPVAVEEV